MSTVSGLIEHAETAPDKPALIVDGIEISYRSLLARFGGAIQVVEIGSAAMPAEHKEKLLHLRAATNSGEGDVDPDHEDLEL